MDGPDSKPPPPPPFAELSSNPPPESSDTYRLRAFETIENVLPEVSSSTTTTTTTTRPTKPQLQPAATAETMASPVPEVNSPQKHLEATMGDQYNAAIMLASSSSLPFSHHAGPASTPAPAPALALAPASVLVSSPTSESAVSPLPEALGLSPPAYDESANLSPRSLSELRPPTNKPIVIPCTTGKTGSPFLRCYAPVLDQYHLPEEVFLKYLDHLNTIAVASPPMQVLGMAHEASRIVPLPPMRLVGGIISGLAKLSSTGYSYGRMELALRELNREVFGPRGLKIEIASMKAVARLAGMPVLDANGRLRTDVPLLGDLPAHEVETVSGLERRLQALAPWIEEVRQTPLDEGKANMWRSATTKMSERERRQQEKLLLNQRRAWHHRYSTELDSRRRSLNDKLDEVDRQQADIIRRQDLDAGMKEARMHSLEQQRQRHQEDFELQKRQLDKWKVDADVEEREMRSTTWLVISVLDKGLLGHTTSTPTASEYSGSRQFRHQASSQSGTVSHESNQE